MKNISQNACAVFNSVLTSCYQLRKTTKQNTVMTTLEQGVDFYESPSVSVAISHLTSVFPNTIATCVFIPFNA